MIIIIIVMTLFTLFVSPTMCLCLLCSIHRPCVFVYFVRFADHVSLSLYATLKTNSAEKQPCCQRCFPVLRFSVPTQRRR